jgi:2-iminoacetate synthase ThiH
MGRLLQRAVERAGLSELCERALAGRGLSPEELAQLRETDVLIVAGLADAVRERHFGDEVRVLGNDTARREPLHARPPIAPPSAAGTTGQQVLFEIALARLATPVEQGLCVSFDALGLELAQVALTFGADALCGDLAAKRVLPLLEGVAARRIELQGLVERAGRSVRFIDPQPLPLESRS